MISVFLFCLLFFLLGGIISFLSFFFFSINNFSGVKRQTLKFAKGKFSRQEMTKYQREGEKHLDYCQK